MGTIQKFSFFLLLGDGAEVVRVVVHDAQCLLAWRARFLECVDGAIAPYASEGCSQPDEGYPAYARSEEYGKHADAKRSHECNRESQSEH